MSFPWSPSGLKAALEVASVPLKKYSPYYRDTVLFDIEDGRLDLATRYRYATGGKEPEINLSGIIRYAQGSSSQENRGESRLCQGSEFLRSKKQM